MQGLKSELIERLAQAFAAEGVAYAQGAEQLAAHPLEPSCGHLHNSTAEAAPALSPPIAADPPVHQRSGGIELDLNADPAPADADTLQDGVDPFAGDMPDAAGAADAMDTEAAVTEPLVADDDIDINGEVAGPALADLATPEALQTTDVAPMAITSSGPDEAPIMTADEPLQHPAAEQQQQQQQPPEAQQQPEEQSPVAVSPQEAAVKMEVPPQAEEPEEWMRMAVPDHWRPRPTFKASCSCPQPPGACLMLPFSSVAWYIKKGVIALELGMQCACVSQVTKLPQPVSQEELQKELEIAGLQVCPGRSLADTPKTLSLCALVSARRPRHRQSLT